MPGKRQGVVLANDFTLATPAERRDLGGDIPGDAQSRIAARNKTGHHAGAELHYQTVQGDGAERPQDDQREPFLLV